MKNNSLNNSSANIYDLNDSLVSIESVILPHPHTHTSRLGLACSYLRNPNAITLPFFFFTRLCSPSVCVPLILLFLCVLICLLTLILILKFVPFSGVIVIHIQNMQSSVILHVKRLLSQLFSLNYSPVERSQCPSLTQSPAPLHSL